jgi:hypothetical protein
MPAKGKGEIAAPVGGMFAACKRVFKGTDKVSVTDEFRSTMLSWTYGTKKERVYQFWILARAKTSIRLICKCLSQDWIGGVPPLFTPIFHPRPSCLINGEVDQTRSTLEVLSVKCSVSWVVHQTWWAGIIA